MKSIGPGDFSCSVTVVKSAIIMLPVVAKLEEACGQMDDDVRIK